MQSATRNFARCAPIWGSLRSSQHGVSVARYQTPFPSVASYATRNVNSAPNRPNYSTLADEIDIDDDYVGGSSNTAVKARTPTDSNSKPTPSTPSVVESVFAVTPSIASTPTNEVNVQSSYNDWTKSFHGLSSEAFPPEATEVLLSPLADGDIEIKPGNDSIILYTQNHSEIVLLEMGYYTFQRLSIVEYSIRRSVPEGGDWPQEVIPTLVQKSSVESTL